MHMYANVIKIYPMVQELIAFSRTDLEYTDGRTDSHSCSYCSFVVAPTFYFKFASNAAIKKRIRNKKLTI